MSTVPVIFTGVFYPKGKTADDKPLPGTFVGNAAIAGLEVGGGPILPPTDPSIPPVDPPLVIWGGPIDPYPDHGLPMPQPPFPPQNPPSKPDVPHEGWNWSGEGWYFVIKPGAGDPQPKRR